MAESSEAIPKSRAVRKRIDDFDPQRYRSELVGIIREFEAVLVARSDKDRAQRGLELSEREVDRVLKRWPRDGSAFFSRSQLVAGYRAFASSERFALGADEFSAAVRMRRVRSLSGVTPVTVFTRPFPCPGRCVFCPNDVRMPKSYLSDEPGAQRAADNQFDPYLQTWNRLAAYQAIGHSTDKVEVIVLGGTWSFHPESYQRWFICRVFEALNDFGAGIDRRARFPRPAEALDFEALPAQLDGRAHREARYNQQVGGFLRAAHGASLVSEGEAASWLDVEIAQRANEQANCRSVGLVVETRPDHISLEEVERIRRLGATKVQIGVQSLDDGVLEQNQRGHDVAATRRAFRLLRGAGFKIHAHWMPNLLGSSPELDVKDYARLFDDEAFRPDELKVYPCSLVESAELVQHYESGKWHPYTHDELLEVLVSVLAGAPRYCRLTRVIRDISSDDILVGNKRTNFREIAQRELERRGGSGCDIRQREVRDDVGDSSELELRVTPYATSTGEECFIEFVTPLEGEAPHDRIAGFARLQLPKRDALSGDETLPELQGRAVLRELHVYGEAKRIGARDGLGVQHRGLGRRLLEEAARIATAEGYEQLAVISAVGTRDYYRARGFEDGHLYQHRALRR
ncbi:MAG: tRNA uridine(34) 5-carboxymethylaminomethyl modification radical SAM/GNAT enzyme Elp3 [Myxococcota bacterium]|nr:tRNA uridine(34) 5-carboxymethylaminomethyl modification radical SAM/GNAT enzyme Elp3 [Myxococcota bacterium]